MLSSIFETLNRNNKNSKSNHKTTQGNSYGETAINNYNGDNIPRYIKGNNNVIKNNGSNMP